ncbi:hypothetical protein GPJ56_004253 [Histomonas meleagridis]|uniref:uncharacterized protein n=1 Tax=Histomonas meleagridis TaxID=135588 RepID=UPI00355A26C5|nr:hypothetical protein GPJ56_004253 [Histomonas meleagridis]KAH0800533.1 hypothetical protein GO595_006736 [Histomonas meleagridis]
MMPNDSESPQQNWCLPNQGEPEIQISFLRSQISDLQYKLNEKKLQSQELLEKIDKIQKHSEQSKQSLTDLNQKLIQKIKQLNNENQKLQRKNYDVFNTMMQIQKAFDNVQKQKSDYEIRIKDLEEQNKNLLTENSRALETLYRSKHSTPENMKAIEAKNAELTKQNNILLLEISKLKGKRKKKSLHMQMHQRQIINENIKLKRKLRVYDSQINTSKCEILRLKTELSSREAELNETIYELYTLKRGGNVTLQEFNDLEKLEDVIKVLQMKCKDLEHVNHRLLLERNELKRSNIRFKRFNEELNSKQKQL